MEGAGRVLRSASWRVGWLYVRKFGRGGFVPSPRFSTFPPWSSRGVFITSNPMLNAWTKRTVVQVLYWTPKTNVGFLPNLSVLISRLLFLQARTTKGPDITYFTAWWLAGATQILIVIALASQPTEDVAGRVVPLAHTSSMFIPRQPSDCPIMSQRHSATSYFVPGTTLL